MPPEVKENDCQEQEDRVDKEDGGVGVELGVGAALLDSAIELVSPLDTGADKEASSLLCSW